MRKPRDNTHLHKTPFEAIPTNEIDDFDALSAALQILAPQSEFIRGLFEADGVTLKPYEPEQKPAPVDPDNVDISKAQTIDEALALFPKESTKKTKVKACLMKGFSTFDIVAALRCSEALVSSARNDLKRDFAAGIIPSLPDSVSRASSLAKLGKPRHDIAGDRNPAVKHSEAGWGSTRNHAHSDKKRGN